METKDLYSELEIVEGCKKNDRKFQELLYRKYAKKMYGICMSYTKDRPMAQDILQDGFVKVFKKIRSFKGEGSLEGWIRKIIVNTALDSLRKKTQSYEFIDENSEVEEAKIDQTVLDNIHYDALIHMVSQLPDGARTIFNLYALEGLTHKEIAEKLNITAGTSKSQYKRARALLQNWLKDAM
mgnify:FL=1